MKLSLLINIKNANYWHFHIYWQRKVHAQLSWAWKKFYNLGACVLWLLPFLGLFIFTFCNQVNFITKKSGPVRKVTTVFPKPNPWLKYDQSSASGSYDGGAREPSIKQYIWLPCYRLPIVCKERWCFVSPSSVIEDGYQWLVWPGKTEKKIARVIVFHKKMIGYVIEVHMTVNRSDLRRITEPLWNWLWVRDFIAWFCLELPRYE